MIMRGFCHGKADRDLLQKEGALVFGPLRCQIRAHVKQQFILAGLEGVLRQDGRIGAAVRVGYGFRDLLEARRVQPAERDLYRRCRAALGRVQYMGGKISCHRADLWFWAFTQSSLAMAAELADFRAGHTTLQAGKDIR